MMLVLMVASCTSLNCPLNNTTYTKYKLMGNVKTLNATLTISTTKQEGEDSVLINKDENVDSFILPMSYHQPEDVFFFEIQNADNQVCNRQERGLSTFRVCRLRCSLLPQNNRSEDNPQLYRLNSYQQ